MIRPIDAPIENEFAAVPISITGLASTDSGRNGSSACVSRQPNASDTIPEATISPTICGEAQA